MNDTISLLSTSLKAPDDIYFFGVINTWLPITNLLVVSNSWTQEKVPSKYFFSLFIPLPEMFDFLLPSHRKIFVALPSPCLQQLYPLTKEVTLCNNIKKKKRKSLLAWREKLSTRYICGHIRQILILRDILVAWLNLSHKNSENIWAAHFSFDFVD